MKGQHQAHSIVLTPPPFLPPSLPPYVPPPAQAKQGLDTHTFPLPSFPPSLPSLPPSGCGHPLPVLHLPPPARAKLGLNTHTPPLPFLPPPSSQGVVTHYLYRTFLHPHELSKAWTQLHRSVDHLWAEGRPATAIFVLYKSVLEFLHPFHDGTCWGGVGGWVVCVCVCFSPSSSLCLSSFYNPFFPSSRRLPPSSECALVRKNSFYSPRHPHNIPSLPPPPSLPLPPPGNGRFSRVVASVLLRRAGFPRALIHSENKILSLKEVRPSLPFLPPSLLPLPPFLPPSLPPSLPFLALHCPV